MDQHGRFKFGGTTYLGREPIKCPLLHKKNKRYEKDRTYFRALHCEQVEEVVTKFNALLANLKAKGYMEADTVQ